MKKAKGKSAKKAWYGERTNVQIFRRLHNHTPRDGAVQVELLMRGVEEADRVSGSGEGKESCVA